MSRSNKQSFLHGALILTIAIAAVKVIGALYKIPLGNILGDEGMGHFGAAYSIYNMLLVLSTAGMPVALSKMISEANAQGRRAQVNRIFSVAVLCFFIIGAVGSGVMFIFSKQFANLIGDSLAWEAMAALSPAVVLVCLMASLRGYFQGQSNMIPTAVSEVIEAMCKLVVGLSMAWWLVSAGFGMQTAAAGAIVGVTVGTAASATYLFLRRRRFLRAETVQGPPIDKPSSRRRILVRLLRLAIPISIGSSALSIINFIDTTLVLNRLQDAAGFTESVATGLYGAYFNAQTLFNLPSAFVAPLTISIIPAVSAALTNKDFKGATHLSESALRITAMLILPIGGGMAIMSGPIMHLFYKPSLADPGTPLLSVLGVTSIFVCFVLLTNAILQSYGMVNTPVYTIILGGIIKIAVNWTLVGTPSINIMGAPIGTTVCYAVISVLNVIAISRVMTHRPKILRIFFKPVIATLLMGVVARGVYAAAVGLVSASLATVAAIGIAAIAYFVLVITLRIVSREDLMLLPKGEKIAKFLRVK